MVLLYDNNAPLFVCDRCGARDETWRKFYDEYLKLYSVEDHWKEPKHHTSCIIGLFCAEYQKRYHIDYTFVPSNPYPFSSKEVLDANVLLATFNKTALDVRRYIIWAFRCGIGSNAKITSLAYLKAPGLIRKFKLWDLNRNVLTRSTQLPKEFLEWCKTEVADLFSKHTLETMMNLGAILNYANTYPNESEVELRVINKAAELGLIKDGKLNVGR
jgi:hypothetical protein